MFATIRRRRRSTKMRNELNQSMDHFKRAASLAAQETSATVGPKINAAKDRVQPAATKAKDAATNSWDSALAALTPLVATATESVRHTGKVTKKQAKKQAKAAKKLERKAEKAYGRKQRRGSRMFGYALLGTAVGVGAAYYARRRRDAQWEEYDPATTSAQTGADDAAFEPIEPTAYTTSNGTVADKSKP
ncbi:hypothetical protein OHA21_38935 [Actinoplanes sp. NBC_00393]|uniref:hypothetical protein n=1 Tax=Actinoplanes sp. NBC_00393 TaxID=2975953 RepID=UPI002E1B5E43